MLDLDPDDLPGCAFGSRLFAPFCPLVSEFHHSSWLFWDGEGEEGEGMKGREGEERRR